MPAPYNNLLTKLEGAAGSVYAATALAVAQFYGIDSTVRTVPNVTFVAELGEEQPQGTGNFNCTLNVQVTTNTDATGGNNHAGLAAQVFDVFLVDDLAPTLSAAISDFTCLGVKNPRQTERTEARLHISELSLECYACASDL